MASKIGRALALFALSCGCSLSGAVTSGVSSSVLKQMSLDDLMNLEVTSVSKTEEPYRYAEAVVTDGTYGEAVAGTGERATIAARYGVQTSGGVNYRVLRKYFSRDETFNNAVSSDDWDLGHVGFRADRTSNAQDDFTVQGDAY